MLFILVALFLCVSAQDLATAFTTVQHGNGTYYGGTTNGNCALQFPTVPAFATNIEHAAMNLAQYRSGDMSRGCGLCAKVWGDGGGVGNAAYKPPIGEANAITVYITDKCPGCPVGDIDFGWSGSGRWNIFWKAVDCPVIGNLQYTFEGSQQWYIRIQPRNNKIPISKVEFLSGSTWHVATRTDNNFFTPPSSFPYPATTPLSVRITGLNGASVVDRVNAITNSFIQDGLNGVQLGSMSPVPVPVPTAAPTKAPSAAPTAVPTKAPSAAPTAVPTKAPSAAPTAVPTKAPSAAPTAVPTKAPSAAPTAVPTKAPSAAPTAVPTKAPTKAPSAVPTKAPSAAPTTTDSPCVASIYGTVNNLWWNAVKASPGTTSVTVKCASSSVTSSCSFGYNLQDAPGGTSPIWHCCLNGGECHNPTATCTKPSGSRLEEETTNGAELSSAGLAGWAVGIIVLSVGVAVLLAALVGLIAYARKSTNMEKF